MNIKELKLTAKREEICKRLDLNNSLDILSYYPYKYENYVEIPFDQFQAGQMVFFEGELVSAPSTFRYRGNRSITRFKVLYDEEELSITIFNRPWARGMSINSKLTIYGKYDGANKVTAMNYWQKPIGEIAGIQPIYSIKEGITQNEIKKLIDFTYNKCADELIDEIPAEYINRHNLVDYKTAIRNIHKPTDAPNLKKAISRLKYEEFLRFFLSLNYLKSTNSDTGKKKKIFNINDINEFIERLPFELTDDQREAVDATLDDLSSNKSMYRLVQGEVGSGKTVVAMIAIYANYLAGYQSALMVPTEILAKQHLESFKAEFEESDMHIVLLCGNNTENKHVREMIQNGEADVIIGTHSLFQDSVEYKNLGLVIADEQHRFGVKQRRALKDKGENVDFMLMSATPIPRTLASSLFGDMDISTIETLPKGRKGCDTCLIRKNSIVDIIDDLKKSLAEGRQAYIIASAIEASDGLNVKDVSNLYKSLIDALKPYKLGLLHGKLNSEEKDKVMKDFNDNNIQVLVSTTVVEVGVNVKNATTMIIYDADRFGLSQLHQLRGRVQRGNYKGKCYLLTNNSDEEVIKRLGVLCEYNDGFKISMEDLKLRGPGDMLGTRQSGLPSFILGDLMADGKFIEAAKNDASEIYNHLDNTDYKSYFEKIASDTRKNAKD